MFTSSRAGMRLLGREAHLFDLDVREGCVQDMAELGVVRLHNEIERETRVFLLFLVISILDTLFGTMFGTFF